MIGFAALLLAGLSPPADKAHEELTSALARVESDSLARVSREDILREAGRWISRVQGLEGPDRVEPVIDSDAALLRHFDMLRAKYAERIDERRFVAAAVDGMIAATAQPGYYVDVTASLALEAAGAASIGVSLKLVDDKLIVVSTERGAPAETALLAGDVIERIDGKAMKGLPLDAAIQLFRGAARTSVVLSVRRGSGDAIEIRIPRENRSIAPDISWDVKNGIGVLRILRFTQETPREVKRTFGDLQKSSSAVGGYVIDIRGNQGGLLSSIIDVGDTLIDKGIIGKLVGRNGVEEVFKARRGDLLRGAPLVLLVDEKTASGAEILAAGLKENGRACIVGSNTHGAGHIQTLILLSDRSAIRLTTGEFVTGVGLKIEGVGITPDIVKTAASDADDVPLQMAEQLLSNPKFACVAPSAASASASVDTSGMSQGGE